jgi:hypothetical protein
LKISDVRRDMTFRGVNVSGLHNPCDAKQE